MSTVLDVISDSCTELGQLGIGQTLSNELAAQGLRLLNRLMQKLSTNRLMLYNIATRSFAISAAQTSITVGQSGTATFNAARPILVELARFSLASGGPELDANLLDLVKWAALRNKNTTCGLGEVPTDVFVDYTYPDMTFKPWPIPSAPVSMILGTWELLQAFATVADVINLPPGYEEVLQHNLALEWAPFFDIPVSQELAALAQDSLAKAQAVNAQHLGGIIGDNRLLNMPNLDRPIQAGPPSPTANQQQ